jgi:dihydrofolate synthase/folylpolyglutamate synthase
VTTSLNNYQQACRYLDNLQMHKIKLGLEAMRTTLARLGSPERACPAIHVAGTNGKGSVCATLQKILSGAGYKTGLYTSPHLSSVRERFKIDDSYIGEADFTRLIEQIRAGLGGSLITYFECTTALAFLWFAESGCDLMILETGMGGRLDATNVIIPRLSVITTISLDHEQYLGNSVEEVAFEKAGIIKAGVPLISGVGDAAASAVIERACREKDAQLILRQRDFTMTPTTDGGWQWRASSDSVALPDLFAGAAASWQADNLSCTIAAAIELRKGGMIISDQHIIDGIRGTVWPGRMEFIETGRRFLLDGAHNQAGIDYLIAALKELDYRRLLVVWASMADKSYQNMLHDIARQADVLLLTRPESERAAAPEDLKRQLADVHGPHILCCSSVGEAYALVLDQAAADDLVVVAGSLYLIGEFRKLLVGEVVR